MNMTKDKIVEANLPEIGAEGIKDENVFNLVVPNGRHHTNPTCSLFSVSEAGPCRFGGGYPENTPWVEGLFGEGEPYIDAVVNQPGPFGEFDNEKIFPSYILIHNPREVASFSRLKRFLEPNKSILFFISRQSERFC